MNIMVIEYFKFLKDIFNILFNSCKFYSNKLLLLLNMLIK